MLNSAHQTSQIAQSPLARTCMMETTDDGSDDWPWSSWFGIQYRRQRCNCHECKFVASEWQLERQLLPQIIIHSSPNNLSSSMNAGHQISPLNGRKHELLKRKHEIIGTWAKIVGLKKSLMPPTICCRHCLCFGYEIICRSCEELTQVTEYFGWWEACGTPRQPEPKYPIYTN